VNHDGTNGIIRTAAASGGLFLGAAGASSLVLASNGNVQLPNNGQQLQFKDVSGSSPYISVEAGGNLALYTTSNTGAATSVFTVPTRTAAPSINFQVPVGLPSGSAAVTQGVGDASVAVATNAFVDRLRSLQVRSVAGTTLVVGDRGNAVYSSGAVTVPANIFAAGDVVLVYNNSAAGIGLTQGASLTLRQSGTVNTGNRTINQRGFATITFISATEAVASGDIV
jgi:hypothetical protein